MLINYLPAAALALVMTVLAVRALDRPADALGLVDQPGGRKVHARSVPLVGGLGVLVGFMLGSLALPLSLPAQAVFYAGVMVIAVTGLLDDFHGLPAVLRLAVQLLVALLVALWGGPVIMHLGGLPFGEGVPLSLGVLAIPVTVFAIVGFMNSMNMMDGADGLAGGVALVIVIGLVLSAMMAGNQQIPAVGLTFAGALAGFLLFNMRAPWRRRAAVFLGDNGSLVIGFVVIWLAIETAMLDDRVVSPVAIGWLIAVPVVETLNLIIRRLLRGQNPFHADREHLHHILRRAGFSVGQTTAIIMTVVALLGAGGMAASILGVSDGWLWAGLVVLAIGHLIFTESGWRTVLAIQRLRQWYSPRGERLFITGEPLTPGREILATSGFYLMVATLPFNVNLPMLGFFLVTAAVVIPGARFSRSVIGEPLVWLALALAGWVVVQGLRMGASPGALWHCLALSGVLALPLGWWLASQPRHLVGGGVVLIAALATAMALHEAAPVGDALVRLTHGPDDGIGMLAAMPLIGCMVLIARQVRRLTRSRPRAREALFGSLALAVGVWLGQLMVQSASAVSVLGPSNWSNAWASALTAPVWLSGAQTATLGQAPNDLLNFLRLTGLPGLLLFLGFFLLLLLSVWRLHQERRWPLRWIAGLFALAALILVLPIIFRPTTGAVGGLVFTTGVAVLWMAAIQSARLRRVKARQAEIRLAISGR